MRGRFLNRDVVMPWLELFFLRFPGIMPCADGCVVGGWRWSFHNGD